jgi:hypothetical protein
MDAVHVASAELGNADVLPACDDRLVRLARRISLEIRVIGLGDLFQELFP